MSKGIRSMRMSVKHEIGLVLGLTGTLMLLVHLVLMVFTDLARRYHGSEMWISIGFLTAITGLLLLRSAERC